MRALNQFPGSRVLPGDQSRIRQRQSIEGLPRLLELRRECLEMSYARVLWLIRQRRETGRELKLKTGRSNMTRPNLVDLKAAYRRNENITRILRDSEGSTTNEQSAILIAYDLQAGSYLRALDDPEFRQRKSAYAKAIASFIEPLPPRSLMEPGVGEATTLRDVLSGVALPPRTPVFGYDLSWSRVHVAQNYLKSNGLAATLFVGNSNPSRCPTGLDVVYTSHAIEPNHGRELEILTELYRVAGRYLVLFEPGYELGSEEARQRMEAYGYCRGLRETADSDGLEGCRAPVARGRGHPEPAEPNGGLGDQERRRGEECSLACVRLPLLPWHARAG